MIDKAEARRMRAEGMTLQEIGARLGVTRERIRQIVGPVASVDDCVQCRAPLPADSGNRRRYCSRRCQRLAHEAANPKHCACGQEIGRRSTRCWDCTLKRLEIAKQARWTHIHTLWHAGFSAAEIAPTVGYANGNALSVQIDRMKKAGWDLPPRRAGWNGFPNGNGGPPKREPETHEQVSARLGYAIRTGKVNRPSLCERCGRDGHVDGHHADYSKPLEVEWLCRSCHTAHHTAEREVAAA